MEMILLNLLVKNLAQYVLRLLPGRIQSVCDLAKSGVVLMKVIAHRKAIFEGVNEVKTAVIWRRVALAYKADYQLQELSHNPWCHMPLEDYDGICPHQQGDPDWRLMKLGFEDLLKRYPDELYHRNKCACFACRANDRVTYLELRRELGGNIMETVWLSSWKVDVCDRWMPERLNRQGTRPTARRPGGAAVRSAARCAAPGVRSRATVLGRSAIAGAGEAGSCR